MVVNGDSIRCHRVPAVVGWERPTYRDMPTQLVWEGRRSAETEAGWNVKHGGFFFVVVVVVCLGDGNYCLIWIG